MYGRLAACLFAVTLPLLFAGCQSDKPAYAPKPSFYEDLASPTAQIDQTKALAMLQVGDVITRAGSVELAGLSRTGLGFAAFTARATPTAWTVVRAGRDITLTIPPR